MARAGKPDNVRFAKALALAISGKLISDAEAEAIAASLDRPESDYADPSELIPVPE